MEKNLVNITEEEIKESAKKAVHEIISGEFYGTDEADVYASQIVAPTKEVHLRFSDGYDEKEDCRHQMHGPFLFIEDVSKNYASACENGVYFHCACLECGKVADYPMSISDRRMVVSLKREDAIEEFYTIQKKYEQLKTTIGDKEKIVEVLNEECKQKQYIKKKN